MALFVYITKNGEEEARTGGLWSVARFSGRIEQSQNTSLFLRFLGPYFVKKKLGGRQGLLEGDGERARFGLERMWQRSGLAEGTRKRCR
jgi:hypothetical protein